MSSAPLVHDSEPRDPGVWHPALALDRLWDGEMVGVRVANVDVVLLNLGSGDIHAYDNRCPHAGTPMSEGQLMGAVLECETHHWQFDAKTGRCIGPRNCALRKRPVRVVDGVVEVFL